LKCIYDWIFADLDPIDNPSAFYLNPLADLTCRQLEVTNLIDTIINVQPKEGGGGGGPSKESLVESMSNSFKSKYDSIEFNTLEYIKKLNSKGPMFEKDKTQCTDGLTYPLNVFYKFEVLRFQNIVNIMKKTLDDIKAAIKGEIIMTPDLDQAINAL
jgi:dynein heavy chain